MDRKICFRTSLFFAIAFTGALYSSASDREKDLQSRVALIFQQHCLSCHNDRDKEGDFSLQTASGLFADGFVSPEDSASSHLLELLKSDDPSTRMPKSADPLQKSEIATIESWIDAGASWPEDFVLTEPVVNDFDWWSYQPVKKPDAPNLSDPWVRTQIDAFILRQLRHKKLKHNPPADKRSLIRRLTYDLIGLPPTPEEVDRFVNDQSPDAYEKLVDRLLDSQRYGERWARHWLDVVKYADTCGYDKDKLRPNAWPYRDYVIRSFNEDKPYGQFVQEQIAGDVLFPGEPDGILGLGFIAAGPWDFIGHVEVSEAKIDGKVARNLDRDDMVSNTLNTFCSVTIQCARCHNHKFDPISQEHYYALQNVFAAVDRAERPYDLDPKIEKQRLELQSRIADRRKQQKTINDAIQSDGGKELTDLNSKIKSLETKQGVDKSPEFGYHSAIAKKDSTSKWVQLNFPQIVKVSKIRLRPCHDDFGGIGAGFGFPIRFKIESSVDGENWEIVRDETKNDFTNPGLTAVTTDDLSVSAKHIRLTATKLALRSNDYILAIAEIEAFGDHDGTTNHAKHATVSSLDSIEAPVRWQRTNLNDGKFARTKNPAAAQEFVSAKATRNHLLAKLKTPERIQELNVLASQIAEAERKLKKLPTGKMVYAAATDFKPQGNFKPTSGNLRPVHVLHRGDIQSPKTLANVGTIPFQNDDDPRFQKNLSESDRRAALARWLTDPNHPLVWRSIVNRVWQYHFGNGLVATPNDFGRMGAKPTHPNLLDWLAVEFRDGGQSLKTLHRMIVTSSVYRQSSDNNEKNKAIDGSNQFLWRMPRRRLSAEEVRDSILAVSGALDITMGGPGFYLFKLERTEHSPHYEYHKFDPADKKSHRRSIYRFIVRSQPDPYMTTLDCADSSQSTPKRNETLTALQALSLLNNGFNLTMAERMAESIASEFDSATEQARRAFSLITQRTPSDSELAKLSEYNRQHGLANLCRSLFNLSEFVFLD